MLASLACALASLGPPAERPEPIRTLLVSGANNHWWEWTTPRIAALLEASGKFVVEVTEDPATTLADLEALADVELFVLDYNGPRWGAEAEANFLTAVDAGAGVAVIHAANNAFPGWGEYERMVGLLWREGTGHGRYHRFDVEIADRNHPITRDLPRMVAHPDELYHGLVNSQDEDFRILMHALSREETGGTGAWEPMVIVNEYGLGRIFHTPLGHVWGGNEAQFATYEDPAFVDLLVRGCEWAATGTVRPALDEPNVLSPAEERAGWRLLFDGRTLSGWREFTRGGPPGDGWVAEDGAIKIEAGASVGDLVTEGQYRDFELAFEWRVSPGANSGVMLRVSDAGNATYSTGVEYQILDDSQHADGADAKTSAAALYGMIAAEPKELAPVGEWNRGRIVMVGNRCEHWLNGQLVVRYEIGTDEWDARIAGSKFAGWEGFGVQPSGRIALQNHGDEVWFRDVKIRDLTTPPTSEVVLFDGSSLDAWTYFVEDEASFGDVWSVAEGEIRCDGSSLGYLRTKEDFVNYRLTLEWRFETPPGGNSGVLLRMHGDDEIWPRSLEAQLESGSAGDLWTIDAFPVRVDPARTAGRRTKHRFANEHPIGEWNRYDVLVHRGDVVLRVNGEVVNQAWAAAEIPGKICLQSEGAPIRFRDFRLRPLL